VRLGKPALRRLQAFEEAAEAAGIYVPAKGGTRSAATLRESAGPRRKRTGAR
jgi:hypothetical protein